MYLTRKLNALLEVLTVNFLLKSKITLGFFPLTLAHRMTIAALIQNQNNFVWKEPVAVIWFKPAQRKATFNVRLGCSGHCPLTLSPRMDTPQSPWATLV